METQGTEGQEAQVAKEIRTIKEQENKRPEEMGNKEHRTARRTLTYET